MHGAVSVVFFLLSMIFFKVLFSDLFHALTNRLKKAAENIVSEASTYVQKFNQTMSDFAVLIWLLILRHLFRNFILKHIQKFFL